MLTMLTNYYNALKLLYLFVNITVNILHNFC